jgi:hypothetical protein
MRAEANVKFGCRKAVLAIRIKRPGGAHLLLVAEWIVCPQKTRNDYAISSRRLLGLKCLRHERAALRIGLFMQDSSQLRC